MANINAHIEQAIKGLETERDQQIASIKAIVMQEKIVPKNAEIDALRDKALQEKSNKLNADIQALQETFATDRQAIIEAAEKEKESKANAVISAETASVAYEYNTKIAELKKLIGA